MRQAKTGIIIPFGIIIDKDSEAELHDLYGEVGYTITKTRRKPRPLGVDECVLSGGV